MVPELLVSLLTNHILLILSELGYRFMAHYSTEEVLGCFSFVHKARLLRKLPSVSIDDALCQSHSQRHSLPLQRPKSLHRGSSSGQGWPLLAPCTPHWHIQTKFPIAESQKSCYIKQFIHSIVTQKEPELVPLRRYPQNPPGLLSLHRQIVQKSCSSFWVLCSSCISLHPSTWLAPPSLCLLLTKCWQLMAICLRLPPRAQTAPLKELPAPDALLNTGSWPKRMKLKWSALSKTKKLELSKLLDVLEFKNSIEEVKDNWYVHLRWELREWKRL